MDFSLFFDASTNQQAISYSQSFRKHIQQGSFDGQLNIEQKREPLRGDEAGGLLSSLLNFQLSEDLAVEFVRSLGNWLKRPKPTHLFITIDTPSGGKITIQGDNLREDGGETLHRILQAIRQEGSKKEGKNDVQSLQVKCKSLIAGARTAQVFAVLEVNIDRFSDHLENDFFLLQNQWNQTEREYLLGVSSKEDINREKARVNYALLEMLDKMR